MTSPAQPSVETVVAELRLGISQFVRRLRTKANPDALNLSEIAALARLEQSGPTTTADLARVESMKPQSMGTVLAGLEREGLVERRPHPTDGRQILFALTEKGVEYRRLRQIEKQDWLMTSVGRLEPEELRILAAALPLIRRIAES